MIYITIIITLFYFIILMWLASGVLKYPIAKNTGFLPGVSVIISAHNEQNNIENLLKTMANQTYQGEFEVIIANDRSGDLTANIIHDYSLKYDYIKLINILETGIGWGNKKWALNQCIKQSK